MTQIDRDYVECTLAMIFLSLLIIAAMPHDVYMQFLQSFH